MVSRLKTIGEWFILIPMIVLFLPFVLLVLLIVLPFFGIQTFLQHIFRKIRKDPEVIFPQLVTQSAPLAKALEAELTDLKLIREYFDDVVTVISERAGAKAIKTPIFKTDWENRTKTHKFREITFKSKIASRSNALELWLTFEELKTEGLKQDFHHFYANEDGDSDIVHEIKVKLPKSIASPAIEYWLSYEPIRYWFAVGYLRGEAKYNAKHRQTWVYIHEYNVWLVMYSNAMYTDFGTRSSFSEKRARCYWIDT